MDNLDYNNVLNVIEFLNVRDSGNLAATAPRYFYLVREYRRLRGPEVVTVSSYNCKTLEQRPAAAVACESISKLQKPPNLVLAFNTTRSTLEQELPKHLPPNTVVLGACAHNIQVNLGAQNVESKSNASVMFASLPDADIIPFSFEMDGNRERELESFWEVLESKARTSSDDHWKAVIVYASGSGAANTDFFVTAMQAKLPNAAIVGGICVQGYVSKPKNDKSDLQQKSIRQLLGLLRELGAPTDLNGMEKSDLVDHVWSLQNRSCGGPVLHHAEDVVFGVVLGGDVPVRSVVSRGVKSMAHGIPHSSSPYVVSKVVLSRPEDPDFLFRGYDLHPIHMIQEITHTDTGTTMAAMDVMTRNMREADFIGIKRPLEDGFELHMISQCPDAILINTDGLEASQQSLAGAQIDFFFLTGEACCQDMDKTMNMLREQTRGEEILGAVMYSCSGRGPSAGGLMHEEMADANRFAKVFPNVPCLGYYAGGEIGPLALAGNQNVFRKGKATVQGFTAVFCLFIVPVVERRGYSLDDSPNAVRAYVQSHLPN